ERTRILPPPAAGQRAGPHLRPGDGRARCAPPTARRPPWAAAGAAPGDRRRGRPDRSDRDRRRAPRPPPRARRRPPGRAGRGRPGHRGGRCRVARLEPDAVGRPGRHLPPGRRAAGRAVAADPERGDHARPVEDGPSGRGRRRVRADRLPPLQRRVHVPDLRGAAGLLTGRLEPPGVPTARGLRLRRHPVQLHRHRGQPARLGGPHGEHGRLEARRHGDAVGLLRHAPVRGGGPAAGRHQPRLRRRPRGGRGGARASRLRGPALHRLDAGVPGALADGRRPRRPLSQLPADRGRDGRQGLHRRPPVRRRRRAGRRRHPRLVRVPGAEVLRGVAALHRLEPVAAAARAARRGRLGAADGRRVGLRELHGRRHRREVVHPPARGDRRGAEHARHRGARRGRGRRRGRLVRPSDGGRDAQRGLPAAPRGALRPGGDGLRLSRGRVHGDARARRPDGTLRADRRGVRGGPGRRARGRGRAPLRRGELLRQRQADRRRRRAAAVRRRPGVRHERQGGLGLEPDPLGEPAHDQGDVHPAERLPLPVPPGREPL
ncbi:MAG: Delta-1-pyrroline-5-carboxylate dehydrogenase, partial [uncultured Thermoleophilia bacterium]